MNLTKDNTCQKISNDNWIEGSDAHLFLISLLERPKYFSEIVVELFPELKKTGYYECKKHKSEIRDPVEKTVIRTEKINFTFEECPDGLCPICKKSGKEVKLEIKGMKYGRAGNWVRKDKKREGIVPRLERAKIIIKAGRYYDINWKVFLDKWKNTLLKRGIDKEFEKFDLTSLKNVIESEKVRCRIFNMEVWNKILHLDENDKLPISAFGFFSISIFLAFIMRGKKLFRRKIPVINDDHKREGELKLIDIEPHPAERDSAFFFIISSIYEKIKKDLTENDFDEIRKELSHHIQIPLGEIELDVDGWDEPFKMAIPEEHRNFLVELFTEGVDESNKINVRYIKEKNSLLSRTFEICFS